MLSLTARWILQHWPFPRGQWRMISLLSKLLLSREENIAPIGSLHFPFQPYQWNFFFGVYEPETKRLINALLSSGEVFLDVGANVGYFSAIAANAVGTSGRVVAIEPEPVHFGRLKRLAEINPNSVIDIIQAAVSDHCGRMPFYVCDHPGWHSLIAAFPKAPIQKTVEVNVWSLDELFIQRELNSEGAVKLVKVDVEGAEHLMLRGASQTITHHWVQSFCIEVTPSAFSDEIFSSFTSAGYQAFRYCPQNRSWCRYGLYETLTVQENVLWISPRFETLSARIMPKAK